MHVFPATDQLPHEPLRVRAPTGPFLLTLALTMLRAVLALALGAPLWLPFALGVLIWGWPPNVPRLPEHFRYLRLACTVQPPAPGLAPLSRVYLILTILIRLGIAPLFGLFWFLDELLFGRILNATPVKAPLILLSGARSGSTQISHYLESDPRLAAPTAMQICFPFLWVWYLAVPTVGRLFTRDQIERMLASVVTEEFLQRHELSAFHTDTFEVCFFMQRLNFLTLYLGPEHINTDVGFSRASSRDGAFPKADFVDFMDRLARKTLYFAGSGDQPKRFYFKGHFQPVDDELAARYPDAHFLTVVREPLGRFKSAINHVHGNSVCEPLGSVPWAWLAAVLPQNEAEYCEREQEWFSRSELPSRTVVRFGDYTRDLEGTMTRIYRECMGDEVLPAYVPREHAERERQRYRVDRGLADLGVDVASLKARLAPYRKWCEEG